MGSLRVLGLVSIRCGSTHIDEAQCPGAMTADEQLDDVGIEHRRLGCVDQHRKLAVVARRPSPAPVAKHVNIGAAVISAFTDERDSRYWPARDLQRRERIDESLIMRGGRLGADTRTFTSTELPCKAGALRAALEAHSQRT